MGEYLSQLWAELWANPLYRAMLSIIIAELVLVSALIVWLGIQAKRQQRQERARQQFLEELEAPFFEALGDEESLRRWMERAQAHPRPFVRDFLTRFLLQTRGQSHDLLVELYHEYDYVADDHQQAASVQERKRIEALRRLYVVATPADREVLLEHGRDDHLSRILAAQSLARVGEPADIVEVLHDLEVRTNLMEAPVFAVLDALDVDGLRYVFTRWQQFESPRMRRILLVTAAEKGLAEAEAALGQAFESEEVEVRIGACAAAAVMVDRKTLELLIGALDDADWQVRARAAKSLGRRRELDAVAPLAEALKDRAFWVRQDAATALRLLGDPGLERLDEVATHSDDRYAAEAASQELQRHRLYLGTRGAPA